MTSPIPRGAFVPFVGYRKYLKVSVDFMREYDPDFKTRLPVVLENTLAYFVLGLMVVVAGHVFPFVFIPLLEFVILGCLLAAAFEVDVMIWSKSRRANWQAFDKIPRQVAKTTGRKIVALGMYHATIFYLSGLVITYLLFPVP